MYINSKVKIMNNHMLYFTSKDNFICGALIEDTIAYFYQMQQTKEKESRGELQKLIDENLKAIEKMFD